MDGKSNSQGAGNSFANAPDPVSRAVLLTGFDFRKVSSFDFTEGRRPA